ncbi:hypothetical protein, partial [Mesorhizobium sp.]|uniref:hypothetical protein n=1 Tax=Mesorhizobium sp. TaxID=1871066 RepID=UPI0025F01963
MPAHFATNSCFPLNADGCRRPVRRRQYSSANSWREYTCTIAFITAPKKTPKKIATRNDGFSGFVEP